MSARHLALGLLVTITALSAVAGQLSGNRADVPSELLSNLPLGSISGLETVNGRPFRVGQVMVARRHDHSQAI